MFSNILFPINLNFKKSAVEIMNNIFTESLFCFLKVLIFSKIILEFGLLYGLLFIFSYSFIISFVLKKFFNLEKLNPNDLLLLGFDNKERNVMICVFFFEHKFEIEKIKQMLLEKGVKANEKLQKKLIRQFGSYYWKKVGFEEVQQRVRILKNQFKNKEEIIKYLSKEVNNHIEIDKEIPYEFQLAKFTDREGGAILFKLDHTLSDGLGMATFAMTLCDNYNDTFIPHVVKTLSSTPLYVKLLIYMLDFVLFPYYAIKLIFISKVMKSQKNPFKRDNPPSGMTEFSYTNVYDFSKINQINKKLKISFNDLMLCVLSASISKFCTKYYPDRNYLYENLVSAIPIGVKNIPKNPSEVQISNDMLGSILSLKRIEEPLTEFKYIHEETKKSVKNSLLTTASGYLSTFMNEFLPYKLQKDFSKIVAEDVDLAISNMPGPCKQISYCGCEVDDMLPVISLGYAKAFIIIATYNNTVKVVVNVDKDLHIDLNLLTRTIEEELNILINKT